MKRLELLKKTGIYFTAAALSASLALAAPAVSVLAADEAVQTESVNAGSTEEIADPEPEPEPEPEPDPEPSGGGGTGSSSSGSSQSGAGASESAGGSSGTTADPVPTDTGKTAAPGTADSSSSSSGASAGTGASRTTDQTAATDKTQAADTTAAQTPAADTAAAQTPVEDTTPVDVPVPQGTTRKNDKDKDLKDRQTTLNPDEVPTGYNQALNYSGTNEQLIAGQNIVSGLSIIRDDFRFYTIDKNLAFSARAQAVHEEMKSASRQVGTFSENDALYILSEEKDGWLYVESGNVRGFVKAKDILQGKDADAVLADLQEKLETLGELTGETLHAEDLLMFAQETVPAGENAAFTYKRCTTKSTVVDKSYAVAETDASILEEASEGAREIGHLAAGNLAYVIMPVNEEWVYAESGNVRGFARRSDLTTGSAAKKIVAENGEASMATAEQLVEPSDNAALYYTLNSVRDGVAYSDIRTEIVQIAAECIGNPYVWGGTSLTYGADCSGFVQTLYSMFGYNIPRVADAQSRYGTQIPISDAAPGDLIFFAANGYVYHVALYAGDGMTIEAYSEDRGIIATPIGNRDAVWATRVIED
ncbi:MAG: C40 family peptidase [Eubacteriales bacterium]|nr:C40 family peptidase [Eubacteriales bacterium]